MDRLSRQSLLAERIINYRHDLPEGTFDSRGLLQASMETFQSMWATFDKSHVKLLKKDKYRNSDYFLKNEYQVTQREYNVIHGSLYDAQMRLYAPVNDAPAIAGPASRAHLPKINIPTFSGHEEDWESFRDLFRSLIDEEKSLTGVQKFHFLKSAVTGSAAKALEKITITEANYAIAWGTLLRRYESSRTLVLRHLNTLSTLSPIAKEDPYDLQTLLDIVSSTKEALTTLGRPTEHWNEFFVLFATRAVDAETRRDWERSIASSDSLPSFDDFSRFVQGRIRALRTNELIHPTLTTALGSSSGTRPRNQLNSLGISLPSNKASGKGDCPLCSDSHALMRCPKFLKANIRCQTWLGQLRLCFNCLKPGHTALNCPSNFSCRECHSRHHTLIHRPPKRSATSSPKKDDTKRPRTETGPSCLVTQQPAQPTDD